MQCSTCGNETEFIGNDHLPECDECYRTNYRFEPKVAPSIRAPKVIRELTPEEQQHNAAVESMRWYHMRRRCLITLGLPTLITAGYKLITSTQEYARSFLEYADKHNIKIPNRDHFERMRDGK